MAAARERRQTALPQIPQLGDRETTWHKVPEVPLTGITSLF
jgi:hypothetical protein